MWQSNSLGNDLLENYNPFSPQNDQTSSVASKPVSSPPAAEAPVITPTQPQQQATLQILDFQKRQEELERKALELQIREEELNKAAASATATKTNNWPPLPAKFCVEPCFYQDIDVEIDTRFQRVVRYLYYVWIAHAALYFLNVAGCLALFIEFGQGTMFGLSILYCGLFTPASYLFWFRPAYKAFRTDSSFNFMVFFVFFFAQFIATVVQTIGFPSLGTCGFIVGLAAIGSHENAGGLTVGILVMLIACCFALLAFADFFFLVRISRLYRSSGASLAKLGSEITTEVMNNPQVRETAADIATHAVRAQFNSSSDPASRF